MWFPKFSKILCYLDATGVVADPGSGFFDTSGYANNVCGGFYIDNLDTAVVSQSNINNIYANSQVPFSPCPKQ